MMPDETSTSESRLVAGIPDARRPRTVVLPVSRTYRLINALASKVSERVVVWVVSYLVLNLLVDSVPLFYDDVSCIDYLVQSRIPQFILIRGHIA